MTDIKQKLREIQALVAKELPDSLAFKPQGRMKGAPTATNATPGGAAPAAQHVGRFRHQQPGQSTQTIVPGGKDAGYQYSGNTAIKAMQKDLINLSKEVVSQINVQDVSKGETDREKGEAASRDSFGNFITKNYLRHSDVPGVEFDPNPKATQISQKTPSTPTRLGVIMDTMHRIGGTISGKSEFATDGKWGPKTQAGVQNAYAFAFALLKLSQDFKLPVKSYTEGNLATLKQLIGQEDGTEPSTTTKIDNAPRISIHLQAIEKLFNEIKVGVLEKPEYRAFIEGDQPFATYKNNKVDMQLNQQQIDAINKAFANKLQVQNKTISIANLLTLDALKSWQQQNAPQMPLQNILIALKKQVPEETVPNTPNRLPVETTVSRPGRVA